MDSKLKQLKVADLKKLLALADVHHPPKATKADLIATILANQPALEQYKRQYGPAVVETKITPAETPVAEEPAPAPAPADPEPVQFTPEPEPEPVAEETSAVTTEEPAEPIDPELEKRKQRAARFGIPLVEPKKSAPPRSKKGSAKRPTENTEKLTERAARFGIPAATATESQNQKTGRKRAPTETVDADELERRKKRAERFGLQAS